VREDESDESEDGEGDDVRWKWWWSFPHHRSNNTPPSLPLPQPALVTWIWTLEEQTVGPLRKYSGGPPVEKWRHVFVVVIYTYIHT